MGDLDRLQTRRESRSCQSRDRTGFPTDALQSVAVRFRGI